MLKILYDQFFQTKIIEEQLRTITKNSYLLSANETNINNEIQSLLNNAVDEYTRLGLDSSSLNQALTQTQINNLQKDSIWFETQVVDGAAYIVPKIYLTQATRNNLIGADGSANGGLGNNVNLANKSTIFAKEDIALTSTSGKITNDGSITGNNVTLLTLGANGDIVNKNFSNITAVNALSITSNAGSITNLSQLKAGGVLSLSAARNITNSSTVLTNDANLLGGGSGNIGYTSNGNDSRDSGNIQSKILEIAGISGGSIAINAANDFTNLAANITATRNILADNSINSTTSGNIAIAAGNDINIATLQLRNRTETSWGNSRRGGVSVVDVMANISSNINSGGDLSLISLNDTTLQAAKINATQDIDIIAQNDLLLLTATDSSFNHTQTHSRGTFAFRNNDRGSINTTILNNEISSGNSSNTNAGVNLISDNTTYAQFKKGSLENASTTNSC